MKFQKTLKAISPLIFLGLVSCTWDQVDTEFDCSVSPVVLALSQSTNTGCDASSGGFTVIATGGQAPYQYTSGTTVNTDGVFADISAGNYAVIVTDANECTDELSVVIENLDGVNLTELLTEQVGCGTTNGSIQVTATGGQEPYAYSINSGTSQASNQFSGLDRGTYVVSVTDDLGCEITESVELLSGVSYESSIKSIIENNCASSSCHPSFTDYSTLQARASSVKSRTGSGNMPRGGSLSQAQIDLIACWVDDGALEN